jgi:hypothetical protein
VDQKVQDQMRSIGTVGMIPFIDVLQPFGSRFANLLEFVTQDLPIPGPTLSFESTMFKGGDIEGTWLGQSFTSSFNP